MADQFIQFFGNPLTLFSLVFFMLGCIVGSFLNVVIHRLPREMSILHPPSHCPQCGYSIPWYRNLPLITWLWQRGKCAGCEARISARYVLVEFLTGAAFLGAWLLVYYKFWQVTPPPITDPLIAAGVSVALVTLLAGLIASTFIDFEHFIIPDELTKGGMVIGAIFSVAVPQLHGAFLGQTVSHAQALWLSVLGMAVGGAVVYAVVRLGKALFGKQTYNSDVPVTVSFCTDYMCLGGEPGEEDTVIPFEDVFYRKGDTVTLHAEHVELVDCCYWDKTVALNADKLTIGEMEFPASEVPHLEVLTSEVTIPREAMGFGDVKFMAAIGAFLGWQATLFGLMASAIVGAVVGSLMMLLRRDKANIIPFGPYIALAAVGWIFGGYALWQWWWKSLGPV
jgi:leader peptidase (prepilin peptidase)/N-methyltransferase